VYTLGMDKRLTFFAALFLVVFAACWFIFEGQAARHEANTARIYDRLSMELQDRAETAAEATAEAEAVACKKSGQAARCRLWLSGGQRETA
jgi:hypothetical protein